VSERSILEAARAVLARDRGATVADVAGAAGVSRATVYRLFGSREALLEALELAPAASTRDRILEAALELVGREGLARLSMDDVAAAGRVSRASLYRLFPGKPALFHELVREYSPLEAVLATLERMEDGPPEEVVPEVARTMARALEGRLGVLRVLFFEITGLSPDASEAAEDVVRNGVGAIAMYVARQMATGRLRPMHPLLALQGLVGPIFMHLMTRPMATQLGVMCVPVEEAVTALAESWVRAMRP
jgi:AcrR family transcriptional regulator